MWAKLLRKHIVYKFKVLNVRCEIFRVLLQKFFLHKAILGTDFAYKWNVDAIKITLSQIQENGISKSHANTQKDQTRA